MSLVQIKCLAIEATVQFTASACGIAVMGCFIIAYFQNSKKQKTKKNTMQACTPDSAKSHRNCLNATEGVLGHWLLFFWKLHISKPVEGNLNGR